MPHRSCDLVARPAEGKSGFETDAGAGAGNENTCDLSSPVQWSRKRRCSLMRLRCFDAGRASEPVGRADVREKRAAFRSIWLRAGLDGMWRRPNSWVGAVVGRRYRPAMDEMTS